MMQINRTNKTITLTDKSVPYWLAQELTANGWTIIFRTSQEKAYV